MEDFFKNLESLFEKDRQIALQRKKEFAESERKLKEKNKEIIELKHVHVKVDRLNGLYPMTKDMLLKRIEMMPNGMMTVTSLGWEYPTKLTTQMLAKQYLDENDLEKIYEYYLTEVKPYIYETDKT